MGTHFVKHTVKSTLKSSAPQRERKEKREAAIPSQNPFWATGKLRLELFMMKLIQDTKGAGPLFLFLASGKNEREE
jgi:hypothetical protein